MNKALAAPVAEAVPEESPALPAAQAARDEYVNAYLAALDAEHTEPGRQRIRDRMQADISYRLLSMEAMTIDAAEAFGSGGIRGIARLLTGH